MPQWTSLFAQKLRAHRLARGQHGRMTQEALAEALGVSLDAIGKYERSVSYIRGDLEARLVDRLGWQPEDVVACREDWALGRPRPRDTGYRCIQGCAIQAEFESAADGVTDALAHMETGEAADLPDGFSAGDTIWRDLQEAGCIYGPYALLGDALVGHVGLIFPGADAEAAFRNRSFDEANLTRDNVRRPVLPGRYFAYCPAVYIARGHEAAGRLLLTGMVEFLEDLARREITLSEIGGLSVSPLGRQLCEDLGLRSLGPHAHHTRFGVWSLPAADIPGSLLGRRSKYLRQVYSG